MPRTGRGGARQGTPGAAYPNRSDMRTAKPPATRFTGQGYGVAKAQLEAQQAVPVAPPSGGAAGAPVPPAAGAAPGVWGAFERPTERPAEPLTAGVPFGPGPNSLPSGPDPGDLQAMAPYLPTLEFMASQSNSSASFRNFVRRLRSQL